MYITESYVKIRRIVDEMQNSQLRKNSNIIAILTYCHCGNHHKTFLWSPTTPFFDVVSRTNCFDIKNFSHLHYHRSQILSTPNISPPILSKPFVTVTSSPPHTLFLCMPSLGIVVTLSFHQCHHRLPSFLPLACHALAHFHRHLFPSLPH